MVLLKFKKLKGYYHTVCVALHEGYRNNAQLLLFILGVALLISGNIELATAQDKPENDEIDTCAFRWGVCQLYNLIEGDFGGLLATLAGILAIIASSVGSYSAAYTMLTVALGCFILRALVSMWFGSPDCGKGIAFECDKGAAEPPAVE